MDSQRVGIDQETSQEWDDLLERINLQYMVPLFVLNSPRDKEVWQYVLGVAAHLEYRAVAMLWVVAGKPGRFEDYEDGITLGGAINKIKDKRLLDPATVENVRAIKDLRNSLAHRGAVYGVTHPGGRQRGLYKGRHVFTDLKAFRTLVDDADAAITAMGDWLKGQEAL